MELLQKITLYDLLGYTVPGCVFILLCGGKDVTELMQGRDWNGSSAFLIIAWICCGYILGIVAAECMEWILKIMKCSEISHEMYKKFNISDDRMHRSLKNAGIIKETEGKSGWELYRQHQGEIYAKIQVNQKYFRIHNYASAVLLYKNMILVSVFGVFSFICKKNMPGIALSLVCTVCFSKRWKRFYEKKYGYCLGWFLEEYK